MSILGILPDVEDVEKMSVPEYVAAFGCSLAYIGEPMNQKLMVQSSSVGSAYQEAYLKYGKEHKAEIIDYLRFSAGVYDINLHAQSVEGYELIQAERHTEYELTDLLHRYLDEVFPDWAFDGEDEYSDEITKAYNTLISYHWKQKITFQDKYPIAFYCTLHAPVSLATRDNWQQANQKYYEAKALESTLSGGDAQTWIDKAKAEKMKSLETK